MNDTELWIVRIVDRDDEEEAEEVESEPYQGPHSPGDNGSHEKSFGTVYFAIERTKDEAEKRAKEVWNRRVRDSET